MDDLLPRRARQVHCYALLASVKELKGYVQTAFVGDYALGVDVKPPARVTSDGMLHLHHVGTQVGEDGSRRGNGYEAAKFQDSYAFQQSGH